MSLESSLYFDIARVGIILATFAYASQSDIKSRIVKHETWAIPVLLGFTITTLQLTNEILKTDVYLLSQTSHFIPIAFTVGTALFTLSTAGYVGLKLFTDRNIGLYDVALPILTTILIYATAFIVLPQTQGFLLMVFSSLLVATALGAFLYFFPVIGMGGADFVAVAVIGVLLPTHPSLGPLPHTLPPELPFPELLITLPVINVLTNTGFLVIIILPMIPILNYLRGNTDRPFLTAFTVEVPIEDLEHEHGQIVKTWGDMSGGFFSNYSNYFTSFDTFFIRDYLEWRRNVTDTPNLTLESQDTVYLERFLNTHQEVLGLEEEKWGSDDIESDQAFFEEMLQQDTIRLMPGLPFIVPLFIAILTLVTFGDVLFFVLLRLNGM